MAKDNREPRPSKARILFGFAEVEGGDGTVTENVRSLAAAVVRALQTPQPPARPVKSLPSPNGKTKPEEEGLFTQNGPIEAEVVDFDPEADADAAALDQDASVGAAATRPKVPRQQRQGVAYAFVPDLDLRPADKPHLKAFFAEKKPEDQMEQLTVFVFYLARVLDLTGITANHLYNCFNEVDKRVPKDIVASCRNTKARRGWLEPANPDDIKITTVGENHVKHDLPKQAA